MESLCDKSPRAKRKEVRVAKKQKKLQSWLQHQTSESGIRQSHDDPKLENEFESNEKQQNLLESRRNMNLEKTMLPKKSDVPQTSVARKESSTRKIIHGKNKMKRTSNSRFEKYLELDMPNADALALEDLEMEKKLGKKLKVKSGKLKGADDGLNMFFEGFPTSYETLEEEFPDCENTSDELEKTPFPEEVTSGSENFSDRRSLNSSSKRQKNRMAVGLLVEDNSTVVASELKEPQNLSGEVEAPTRSSSRKKCKKLPKNGKEGSMAGKITSESQAGQTDEEEINLSPAKVDPVRPVKYVAPHLRSQAGNESEDQTQIRRRVRGLLNKLSESNVESITGEIATIFRSASRNVSSHIISEEVLASCHNGPRGNEQHAAVFAAFVAGMASLVGIDFGANLLASLAMSFEAEYVKQDNPSLRNLTLLLSYLCILGVCSSDIIYDFLIVLSMRLSETDVSTILTILQCCGMKIRADDPGAMKSFILSVQNRVNELKAAGEDGQKTMIGKRMEFMLETILDIKNNKKKSKEDTPQHIRIKKWLQKLGVEGILIKGVKWNKLLDPEKKGQWWFFGDKINPVSNVEEVASRIDKEVTEAQKMLQLAAAQRMNTEVRRAIFCIIMSGEDYIDTFEKLLRLDLSGKQDREIIRVIVECCLQEKVFNKYYTVLATKLCEQEKNHKFTLQYCLWDQFKELESMTLVRSMHLAKFTAELVASFTLSLAVLKTVDLNSPMVLTPKKIMHFRMLFEAIFENPEKIVWNAFTRIAVMPELEDLRSSIEFFVKEHVVRIDKKLSTKFKVARKALNNLQGIVM